MRRIRWQKQESCWVGGDRLAGERGQVWRAGWEETDLLGREGRCGRLGGRRQTCWGERAGVEGWVGGDRLAGE